MQVQMNTNQQSFGSVRSSGTVNKFMKKHGMLDAFEAAKPQLDSMSDSNGKDFMMKVLSDTFLIMKAVPKTQSTFIEKMNTKFRDVFNMVRTPSETSKRLLNGNGTKISEYVELGKNVLGAYKQEVR